MILVVMGVSGSGKTTVGKALADELGWAFVEADDFHPAANVEKMSHGIALADEDRRPWLEAIRQQIDQVCARGAPTVFACSALKQSYRDYLRQNSPECVRFVYLRGSEDMIRRRLADRKGHFMDPGLLRSQFDALESPDEALHVDIAPAPAAIVAEIVRQLGLGRSPNAGRR